MKLIISLSLIFLTAFTYEAKLANPSHEQAAQNIFKLVKCLACTGESIAESNAEFAASLRSEIRSLVKSGKTEEQVKTTLKQRYGDDILLDPEVNSYTSALWFSPVIILILATFLLYRKTR